MADGVPGATRQRLVTGVAVVLHLGAGFFYALSGLVAPTYGVIALGAVWFALLGVLVVVARRRPGWALAVPLLAFALWVTGLQLGAALFGWTA